MGKKTLTTSAPQSLEACVHLERRTSCCLNERRIALTELTIKLQVRTSSPLASAWHIIDQMLEER